MGQALGTNDLETNTYACLSNRTTLTLPNLNAFHSQKINSDLSSRIQWLGLGMAQALQ